MTAYDVNPFSGSEAGMGWNFAFYISKHHNVFLVTRKNNRDNIELWIKQNIKNYKSVFLEISYYDLPDWVLSIKGGSKLWALYYYFWQLFLAIKYRQNIINCDLSHALNFHSDIFPSFLWIYSKVFFWGPINHHEKIPRDQLIILEGLKGYIKNRIIWFVKLINWRLNVFLLLCQKKSNVVFVGSSAVKKRWYGNKRYKLFIPLSSVGVNQNFKTNKKLVKQSQNSHVFTFLSVGRFITMKSFELSVMAYMHFLISNPNVTDTRLLMIGKGPSFKSIEKYVKNVPSNGRVEFVQWVDHSEIGNYFLESDIFLFPSHEGAGMVVVEALRAGLPVLCLLNNGPSELIGNAGVKVHYTGFYKTAISLAHEMTILYNDCELRNNLSIKASERVKSFFWSKKASLICKAYKNIIAK